MDLIKIPFQRKINFDTFWYNNYIDAISIYLYLKCRWIVMINRNRFVTIDLKSYSERNIELTKRNVGYVGRMNQIINFRRNRPVHLLHCKERSINIAFHEM